jgi:hypothetical protein
MEFSSGKFQEKPEVVQENPLTMHYEELLIDGRFDEASRVLSTPPIEIPSDLINVQGRGVEL